MAQSTGFDFVRRHHTIEILVFIIDLDNKVWFDDLLGFLVCRPTATGLNFLNFGYLRRYKDSLISETENLVYIGTFVLKTTPHPFCKISSKSFRAIIISIPDTFQNLTRFIT